NRQSAFESGVVSVLFADPALHADLAVDGAGFGEAVVDVLAKGVQRHATLALPFAAGDVRTTQAAGALDADAFGAERHGHLDGLLHRTTEGNAALELEGDILGNELRLGLRFLHLLDVEQDLLAGELGEVLLDLLDLLTLAADDDAGTGGVDLDANAVGRALDEDPGHRGLAKLFHELLADHLVLMQENGEVLLVRVPAGLPVATDSETETDGIGLLAHG